MTDKDKIVMPDSDEAASIKTVTGWVDRTGRFWGGNENTARYCGSTHKTCGCGDVIPRDSYCNKCYERREHEKWKKADKHDFVGDIAIWAGGKFYLEAEDFIEDLVSEQTMNVDLLRPEICERKGWPELCLDGWAQDYANDDGEIPDQLLDAIAAIEKTYEEHKKENPYHYYETCNPFKALNWTSIPGIERYLIWLDIEQTLSDDNKGRA